MAACQIIAIINRLCRNIDVVLIFSHLVDTADTLKKLRINNTDSPYQKFQLMQLVMCSQRLLKIKALLEETAMLVIFATALVVVLFYLGILYIKFYYLCWCIFLCNNLVISCSFVWCIRREELVLYTLMFLLSRSVIWC